jgi:hypothetical protein
MTTLKPSSKRGSKTKIKSLTKSYYDLSEFNDFTLFVEERRAGHPKLEKLAKLEESKKTQMHILARF